MKDPVILATFALACLIRADQAPHQRGIFVTVGTLVALAAAYHAARVIRDICHGR
jgi:hypothetical protein